MHSTIKTLSILAIAGTALAAPQGNNWRGWSNWGGNRGGQPAATATNVAVVTAYTTVTYGGNWGGQPTATPSATKAVQTQAPPKASPTAVASSAPVASSTPVASGNSGYIGTVESWRSKMGLSGLTEDSSLQANAMKTAVDGNGNMVHQLNPGSMAQVLAPGSPDDFEKVFVGGWLCERPSLAGLDGICSSMSAGWAYGGETGHADILVSGSYSKIGCANSDGIWACDLS